MTTTLSLSSDRKVTNAATKGGNVAIKNAFGLPAGISCPGMTAACETICYARQNERQYVNVKSLVMRNYDALKDASIADMVTMLGEIIAEFVKASDRRGADKVFRIHWDGDFFSRDYAQAWADVVRNNPDVQFWVYTRSFVPALDVLDIITGIDNLAVYLSVDEFNSKHAAAALVKYGKALKVAMLADTQADAGDMIKSIRTQTGSKALPGAKCPENIKAIPLITPNGGACFSCNLCVQGKADVRFAIKKR